MQVLIKMPRPVADGTLNANHLLDLNTVREIDVPQVGDRVGRDNALITEEKSLSEFFKLAPLIWDFILNAIDIGKAEGAIYDVGKHHYEMVLDLHFFADYLQPIKDRNQKYKTHRAISDALLGTPSRVLYVAKDGRLELGFPIIASLVDENYKDTTIKETAIGVRILLQKGVFEALIEGNWKGSQGYIKIPANYFPVIQSIEGDEISHKAHYRLQVLARSKNTMQHNQITVDTEVIKRSVVPEEYKINKRKTLEYKRKNPLKQERRKEIIEDGFFESMAGDHGAAQHNYFSEKLKILHDIEYHWQLKEPILRNIYFEKKETTLYFTTEKNRTYHKPESTK